MSRAVGPVLAHRVGGEWDPDLQMVFVGRHHIAIKPGTGKIMLDYTFQLGTTADTVEYLAGRYAVVVAGSRAA